MRHRAPFLAENATRKHHHGRCFRAAQRHSSFRRRLMPTIDLIARGDDSWSMANPAGPYGANGAGEMNSVPPRAAIANAIFNATGVVNSVRFL